MKLDAGDVFEFEDGKTYTISVAGDYHMKGYIKTFNGISLNIDWNGIAFDDTDIYLEQAIEDMRKRLHGQKDHA
jgi:hypothetical protein